MIDGRIRPQHMLKVLWLPSSLAATRSKTCSDLIEETRLGDENRQTCRGRAKYGEGRDHDERREQRPDGTKQTEKTRRQKNNVYSEIEWLQVVDHDVEEATLESEDTEEIEDLEDEGVSKGREEGGGVARTKQVTSTFRVETQASRGRACWTRTFLER